MPIADRKVDYIAWADVYELARHLERGFSVSIFFKMRVACPPGEQFPKAYWEVFAEEKEGEPVPTAYRCLGTFPNGTSKAVPAMQLGMLYKLEAELSGVRLWVEPTIQAQRGVAEH